MKTILIGIFALSSSFSALGNDNQPTEKISVEVTEKGFAPSLINVKPGTDVTLQVTRKTDNTCSTEIQIPAKKIKKTLPLNETVTVALGNLNKGEIRFGCGMNMMEGGKILVR